MQSSADIRTSIDSITASGRLNSSIVFSSAQGLQDNINTSNVNVNNQVSYNGRSYDFNNTTFNSIDSIFRKHTGI
jgi:hypothetical protein